MSTRKLFTDVVKFILSIGLIIFYWGGVSFVFSLKLFTNIYLEYIFIIYFIVLLAGYITRMNNYLWKM